MAIIVPAESTDEALMAWDNLTAGSPWSLDLYIYSGGIIEDKKQETSIEAHHYRVHSAAIVGYSSAHAGAFYRGESIAECIKVLIAYLKTLSEDEFNHPGVHMRVDLNAKD